GPIVIMTIAVVGRALRCGGTVSFFFSSRRRHTRSKRDWSSDVCSSDLLAEIVVAPASDRAVGAKRAAVIGPRAHLCHGAGRKQNKLWASGRPSEGGFRHVVSAACDAGDAEHNRHRDAT